MLQVSAPVVPNEIATFPPLLDASVVDCGVNESIVRRRPRVGTLGGLTLIGEGAARSTEDEMSRAVPLVLEPHPGVMGIGFG